MFFLERKPALPLRHLVRSLWYMSAPTVECGRERMLPTGCAHIVLSLSQDFLTECVENQLDQRSAAAVFVGQRSLYELVSTNDFLDLAGVLFEPGAVPALLGDRADLISNRTLSLDEIWPGAMEMLRGRMLKGVSPEQRLQIFEETLGAILERRGALRLGEPHLAVRFALRQMDQHANQTSIAELAKLSGWSERRFSQLFREQVGFVPKAWQRLRRFQHMVEQMNAGIDVRWADLAVDCGFYDQAHLANEFRSFAGVDLTTYVKRGNRD